MYGSGERTPAASRQGWQLEDIPYERVEREAIAGDEHLFFLLTAASFVEIASDLYAGNLVDYFCGDGEVCDWLAEQWQGEEIQHGKALRRYVETVWPQFDWAAAYGEFRRDYARYCRPEELGPTPGLEMAARCVVETGTATLYTTLERVSPEPVLAQLARHIRNDEVRHYRHFFHHFQRYRGREPMGRLRVLRALWGRVAEVDNEDALVAYRNIFAARFPQRRFSHDDYRAFVRRNGAMARGAYPYSMAVNMFLKPLALPPRLRRWATPVLSAGARRFTPH